MAEDDQISEDARISLAELKPLEQAVRTAHAEVRRLLPHPHHPLTTPFPPPYYLLIPQYTPSPALTTPHHPLTTPLPPLTTTLTTPYHPSPHPLGAPP